MAEMFAEYRPPRKAWRNKAIYDVLRAADTPMSALEIALAVGFKKGQPGSRMESPARYVSIALSRLHSKKKIVRTGTPGAPIQGAKKTAKPGGGYRYALRDDDPDGDIYWQGLER